MIHTIVYLSDRTSSDTLNCLLDIDLCLILAYQHDFTLTCVFIRNTRMSMRYIFFCLLERLPISSGRIPWPPKTEIRHCTGAYRTARKLDDGIYTQTLQPAPPGPLGLLILYTTRVCFSCPDGLFTPFSKRVRHREPWFGPM